MQREQANKNRRILIDFLDSATRYYVLLYRHELITNITYYRKGLDEIGEHPREIENYLKEMGFSIDIQFSDNKHNIFFWCEQSSRYDEVIPDLLGLLALKDTEEDAGLSTSVIKDTISDFYSLFAVNIGDDFLFSYLIGTIVRLVNAEVGLLQVVNEMKISNFSMGFSAASLEYILYKDKSLADYLVETKQTLIVPDTGSDPDIDIEKDHAGHVKSLLCVPIYNKGELIALIYLINKSYASGSHQFGASDVEILSTISIQIGSIITNALLYKKMTELKEFNEEVLENIPAGIQTTSLDNKILFKNKYMRDLLIKLQMEAQDLIYRILDEEHEEFFGKEFVIDLENGPATLSVSRRYLKIGANPPIFLYTFIDVTAQKQMEAQLRKTEKLAVAGELIAGIAHEIKNPLTSMKGFADLIWKRIDDREFVQKFATIISDEINRLNQLIERFLSFAKPELGLMSDVNLSKIIADTLDIISYNIRKSGIELSLTLDDALIVHGSREMLIQVFINILLNAIHAVEDSDKPKKIVRIYSKFRSDLIEVIVEDNGVGIGEDHLDKVFNPFFTTKNTGSGLGLAISHRIMTEHHGTIRIESKAGAYTRMILGFPAIKEPHRIG